MASPRPVILRPLQRGRHTRPEDGLCAMELAAWIAGEAHCDEPECVCPTLTSIVRCLNDRIFDGATRDRLLRRFVPRLVHTAAGEQAARDRALALADCCVRELLPELLSARGRRADARLLRELPSLESIDGQALAASAAVLGSLRTFPGQRAAAWTLRQAAAGRPPELWVTGLVHCLEAEGAWRLVPRLLERGLAAPVLI